MSTSPDPGRPQRHQGSRGSRGNRSRRPLSRTAGATVAALTGLTLTGCVIGTPDDAGQTVVTVTGNAPDPTTTDSPAGTPAGTAHAADLDVSAPYTVAWSGDGTVTTGGTLESGLAAPGPVAWSTSKIPVAVAALRAAADGSSTVDAATVQDNVTAAVTASDNAAAQALWDSLGDPETAGRKVTAVLREGGDTATTVQTRVTRPGLTSFGQTVWTAENQVRFATKLACLPGADPVLAAMGQITAGQDYGLGRIDGARFKGGWGPDTTGAYQVRQFGLVPGADGTLVPVAVETVAADGSYDSGAAALDEIVTALAGTLAGVHGITPGSC